MPDARAILATYRETLQALRRRTGPAGALLAPLELTADVLDELLTRQQELEAQVAVLAQPLVGVVELAQDGPAMLRTQAKAFEAASASFAQAATVLHVQADLLERTLGAPGELVRAVRRPKAPPSAEDRPAPS